MEKTTYDNYLAILKSEMVPALGCTEPIAIAFAAAKAREVLGCMPETIQMACSGNIIKNVKGVTVPNAGGLKGIEVAAVLGAVGGKADKNLEVLQGITPDDIEETKRLVAKGICTCDLIENEENLYIIAKVKAGNQDASVEIKEKHTHITKITKNGKITFMQDEVASQNKTGDKSLLNVKEIIEFADTVKIDDVKDILDQEIQMNMAIANEGLKNNYGAQVGKTLIENFGTSTKTRARAMSAAGSDARMSGCALPVVINSGSGNQGMTVSIPVIVYAQELQSSKEELYRALVLANLISIHQKKYIGSLSAYCGATSAACAAGCGITYLYGGRYEEISKTIINTIANIGGMVCDGAKPSCAAKVASAVDAGILGYMLSKKNHVFKSGEGLVEGDVEQTIKNMGRMGKIGMKSTDIEILNIMLGK